MERQIKDWLG
jgi:tetratricopeptide (TPR) repeat protein